MTRFSLLVISLCKRYFGLDIVKNNAKIYKILKLFLPVFILFFQKQIIISKTVVKFNKFKFFVFKNFVFAIQRTFTQEYIMRPIGIFIVIS